MLINRLTDKPPQVPAIPWDTRHEYFMSQYKYCTCKGCKRKRWKLRSLCLTLIFEPRSQDGGSMFEICLPLNYIQASVTCLHPSIPRRRRCNKYTLEQTTMLLIWPVSRAMQKSKQIFMFNDQTSWGLRRETRTCLCTAPWICLIVPDFTINNAILLRRPSRYSHFC